MSKSSLTLHKQNRIHITNIISSFLSRNVDIIMDVNDANLQSLMEFLRKTLDPDPLVRRPGERPFKHNRPC